MFQRDDVFGKRYKLQIVCRDSYVAKYAFFFQYPRDKC